MGIGNRRSGKIFSTILVVSLLLGICGCGAKKEELPPDTPWNSGHYAIMETENGYYSNLVGRQCLCFYEKETGKEIFLCAKPECQHDGGESCTATYHNMKVINSVLYEEAIYILAVEDVDNVVSFNIYKAALDGSALDKVGEVFSAQNRSEEDIYLGKSGGLYDPTPFIIHKGYAYIPFFLAFKWSAKGFVNGGIMKMDIRNGQTEQIYQMEELTGPYPTKLWGCGDYLYYNMGSKRNKPGWNGTYRYNILDGSEEYVYNVLWPDQKPFDYYVECVTEDDVFYAIGWNGDSRIGITRYEPKDGELLHDGLFLLEEDDGLHVTPVLYEDKFFIYGENAVSLYDMDGKRLGRLAFDFPGLEGEFTYQTYGTGIALNISGGRLYAACRNPEFNDYLYLTDPSGVDWVYSVFACSIEDLSNGQGKWELVYSAKDLRPGHIQGGNVIMKY